MLFRYHHDRDVHLYNEWMPFYRVIHFHAYAVAHEQQAEFHFYESLKSNLNLDDNLIPNTGSPVYLSNDELVLINEYLKQRSNIKNVKNKPYLIVSSSSSEVYQDRPIKAHFIARKVKALCGFTPKSLRITCFNTIASHFGPQLLVEGFGLSLTQASRYGKLEDYLIEEQIQSEREYLNK